MISNVLETIEQINKITTDRFKESTLMDGEEYYVSGGCFEFSCILKELYPDSNIYVKYDRTHLCNEIDGVLYDAAGVIEDTHNYQLAREEDIDLIIHNSNNYFRNYNIGEEILGIINGEIPMR